MSIVTFADGNQISDYGVPYIIAEVNSSHNGNVEVAKAMIDAAKMAGCDCVKFQSWSSKSLYSKTYYKQNPIAKRFVDKFALSTTSLKELAAYCQVKGIGFSSTPYSREEVDFLADECQAPFIKISSMEINNPDYLEYISKKNIPIVLSTGMATFDEVVQAVNIIEKSGNKNVVILHCVSLYPTDLDKANLNNILSLRTLFPHYPIGFSDHTLGDIAAISAVSLGAAVIEKHITLDVKKIGMDNQMAMEPEALNLFVEKCKSVPKILGNKERVLQQSELQQRNNMRRSIVVTRDLKAGDIIEERDLDVKRPGSGMAPLRIKELVGKKVKVDVEEDTLLKESDLQI